MTACLFIMMGGVMDVSMLDISSMEQVEVLRGGNEMFLAPREVSILFQALIMATV